MPDITPTSSAQTPPLRLVRYDQATQIQVAAEREQQLSAQLDARITTQLDHIRQRLAGGGGRESETATEPASRLDILA